MDGVCTIVVLQVEAASGEAARGVDVVIDDPRRVDHFSSAIFSAITFSDLFVI